MYSLSSNFVYLFDCFSLPLQVTNTIAYVTYSKIRLLTLFYSTTTTAVVVCLFNLLFAYD